MMKFIKTLNEIKREGWDALVEKLGIAGATMFVMKLKGLMPYNPKATTDLGYFRFHGRNTNWFDASVAERYDYLYTPEELRSFIPGIKNISSITGKAIVMFNNCHAGKSVKNAIDMLNLINAKSVGSDTAG